MGVKIHRLTGNDGGNFDVATDITSINTRLNAEDAHTTAGTTNPIRIPASGTNYSFWANTRLYFDGSGTGDINNIVWFTDGANGLGTGIGLQVALASVYGEAQGTVGETGEELTVANYGNGTTDLNGAAANAFTYTTGSPLTVDGSVSDPANEYFGDIVVLQTTVADTASPGPSAAETMTFRYDSTVVEA